MKGLGVNPKTVVAGGARAAPDNAGVTGASPEKKSVHPFAVLRSENRQFFHHELRFADSAGHVNAGRVVEFFRHAFAGVTPPAFGMRTARENASIDLGQLVFVQE